MSFISFSRKEISFKIVYYGAAMCGKTTNVAHVHKIVDNKLKGELTVLSTQQDRTLYFDFLPLKSDIIKGFTSKFQLYTVPGQVIYNETRKLVLRNVDGIVFVADSQWEKMEENAESFTNLESNLNDQSDSLAPSTGAPVIVHGLTHGPVLATTPSKSTQTVSMPLSSISAA